jgi:hypothetical protein
MEDTTSQLIDSPKPPLATDPATIAEQIFGDRTMKVTRTEPMPERLGGVFWYYEQASRHIVAYDFINDQDKMHLLKLLAQRRGDELAQLAADESLPVPVYADPPTADQMAWLVWQLQLHSTQAADALQHVIKTVAGAYPEKHPNKRRLLVTLRKARELLITGELAS